MTDYTGYVIAAYAVFVAVLGWDFFASRLQIRRELRNARLRGARHATRATRANNNNEWTP